MVLVGLAMIAGLVVHAQTRTITGTVSGATGETLTGVTVSIPGTTTGSLTDADGKFSINVPAGATTLQFSFIGMETVNEQIGNRSVIDVVMKESTLALDEVVVVGYGTVRKRDLTGSVSSVRSEEISKTASSNALQSIQGKVAGLDITRASGETGSEINMTLRGVRSVNASNSPLFLVDGIEYGATLDINPSDIASIEVLKDASSTAIYGTRGANGVIIITTRRGDAGTGKSTISFNSYVSLNSPTNLPRIMDVQKEYLFLAERLRYAAENVDDSWGSTSLADYPPEAVLSNVLTSPWEKTVLQLYNEGGVDWFDMIMQNSVSQNYELSASGGSENTSFIISLGYMNENGLLKNDNLKRYNGRININHKISKKLNAGANLQFTYRDWDRREDNVYAQLIKMHSLAEPYLSDGSILDKPSELAVSHTNPLLNEVPGFYTDNTLSNRLFGNVFLNWEIVSGLQFKSSLGIDAQSGRQGIYEDYMCTANYQFGRGSYFSTENDQGMKYILENTLTYTRKIGAADELQILAGQAAQRDIYESHRIYGYGLQDHYAKTSFYFLQNILATGRQLEDIYTESSLLSYFGRVNYKLLDKYLFTATLRTDGSSVLAEGNKWDLFPSLAAAWVLSEEPFIKSIDAIDLLKLRLSWGKAGNAAVDPYMTKTRLGSSLVPYTFGSTLYTGMLPAILGNPDVTWETTATYDAGIDLTLWKERLSVVLDAYYSRTYDLLLYKGLPATSVYPQVLANVGETQNIGFEASVSARIVETNNFSWNSDATFSINRDKILALASGAERDVSIPDNALVVGEPVRAFYNYEADGCWTIAEAETAALYNRIPGDIRIVDANDDGVIDELDKRLYNKSPKFIFSWNNSLSYKGLTLSGQLFARVGQWIQYDYNTAYKPTEQDGSPDVDFWTPENQTAKFPRPGIASQNDMPALAFEKASYLKLREVTLSYNLPSKLITKAGLSRVRIYSSLQNFFTFSNLDNYDPERGGSISNPMAKHMVFGLNLEF